MGKERKKAPREIFFGIGIALLFVIIIGFIFCYEGNKSNPDYSSLWNNIAVSIMCSVIASVIFVILQKCFEREENKELNKQLEAIEDKLKLQNELYDSGIISIHPKSYFDKEEAYWNKIINNTENRLELIGHSLSNWFKPEYRELFCGKIEELLNANKDVQIVLSSDSFDYAKVKQVYADNLDKKVLNKIERTVYYLLQLLENVNEDKRKFLKIYVTERAAVTYLYIRTDDQCIISPYILGSAHNQDSFLLELMVGTEYTKIFEDDFNEMIDQRSSLNLLIKGLKDMKLVQWITNENNYTGSDWDFEKTIKYVFKEGEKKFEVGYFEHYCKEKFMKSVVELPVSYGCSSKCQFCASSSINDFYLMNDDQMQELFEYVYYKHKLYEKEYVLVTMTGTGDIAYNTESVIKFLMYLTTYQNVKITVSSCLWSKDLLKCVEDNIEAYKIRNIQITYVTDEHDKLKNLIPIYANKPFELDGIIEYIKSSQHKYYRINYIMIKDVNDADEDFERLGRKLLAIKNKVIVRISKLNETGTTRKNNLDPAEDGRIEKLKEILQNFNIKNYMFSSETNDKMNCGQLITEKE